MLLVLGLLMISLLSLASPANADVRSDPLEPINRVTFQFNTVVDKILFKPLARSYDTVVPGFAKRGVRNFFRNLGDVGTAANNVLQGKFEKAGTDLGRVAINSTIGIGGLIDVADNAFDLQRNDEDFGQTLASWNMGSGPYLVLPLLGPSSLRDGLGSIADTMVDPVAALSHEPTQTAMVASRAVDRRVAIFPYEEFIIGDAYLYVREAYLQNREYKIADGDLGVAFAEAD